MANVSLSDIVTINILVVERIKFTFDEDVKITRSTTAKVFTDEE